MAKDLDRAEEPTCNKTKNIHFLAPCHHHLCCQKKRRSHTKSQSQKRTKTETTTNSPHLGITLQKKTREDKKDARSTTRYHKKTKKKMKKINNMMPFSNKTGTKQHRRKIERVQIALTSSYHDPFFPPPTPIDLPERASALQIFDRHCCS